jgi:2-succinyl-5-enolpyruvyl-6-hydroxy-3-cyclohexene-1-carboxylate synthase
LTRSIANLQAALTLLEGVCAQGLRHLVLCPGSRSGPLAHAAGGLARRGRLALITAIDERSAAFHALGIGAGSGRAVAVITTSGTAVANLLPAAVEADRSCLPLLLLSADRPERLKHCGANQTVNQETFLRSVCRWMGHGDPAGIDRMEPTALQALAVQAWGEAHRWPGPVHLNLPFEEPLHPSAQEQEQFWRDWADASPAASSKRHSATPPPLRPGDPPAWDHRVALDPDRPGVVIAGPWRGQPHQHPAFRQALRAWLQRSGWPLLVDPLAAIPADLPGQVHGWDLLLPDALPLPDGLAPRDLQVLRLGPMPASRRLERWLQSLVGPQVVISEGERRGLDPLRLASQWPGGLASWWQALVLELPEAAAAEAPSQALRKLWQQQDQALRIWLEAQLPARGAVSEPALMRALPCLLPHDCAVMLAASSPVRDWLAFAPAERGRHRCISFRGASGIDGTLSLALGLARAHGRTLLLTGDLALLHDSNGWLLASAQGPPLLVLLIDNGGGGIFEQLPVPVASADQFDQLFAMPQAADHLALAAAHGVPGRPVACLEDLAEALDWGWAQGRPALLRVRTDRGRDAALRLALGRAVQAADHNDSATGCLP